MGDAFDYGGDPAHYRRRAANMRALAGHCADPRLREMMDRLAADYDLLAEQFERRLGPDRPPPETR
jgi:hypothetical protein